jgi:hypothetical protein
MDDKVLLIAEVTGTGAPPGLKTWWGGGYFGGVL